MKIVSFKTGMQPGGPGIAGLVIPRPFGFGDDPAGRLRSDDANRDAAIVYLGDRKANPASVVDFTTSVSHQRMLATSQQVSLGDASGQVAKSDSHCTAAEGVEATCYMWIGGDDDGGTGAWRVPW